MESEGVNYFFKSREEFKKMIENNDFLEYAKVYDNYYGTPRKYVQQKLLEGRDVILEIDIQGALKVKDRFDEGVLSYTSNHGGTRRRIVKRGTENLTLFCSASSALKKLILSSDIIM